MTTKNTVNLSSQKAKVATSVCRDPVVHATDSHAVGTTNSTGFSHTVPVGLIMLFRTGIEGSDWEIARALYRKVQAQFVRISYTQENFNW